MKTSLATAFEGVLRVAGLADLCDVCGGITAQSKPALIIRAGEELRACKACGVWLDPEGRPAGGRAADGEVVLGVVVVHGRMARAPEMPRGTQGAVERHMCVPTVGAESLGVRCDRF